MFGWGRLKLPAFIKLSSQLVRIAWQKTRLIQVGEEIEFTVKLKVGEDGKTEKGD